MIAKLIVVLLLIVILAGIAAALFVDPIARGAVERSTTYATGTQSSLASADVGLMRGDVVLSGLTIDNAGEFDGLLLELARVRAEVEMRTLIGDVLRMPEVLVEGLVLNVVQVGLRSNITPILARLRELSEAPPGQPPDRDEGDAGRRAVIDRLVIRGLEVRATLRDVSLPGVDPVHLEDMSFTFPEIVLEDLGEPRTLGEWVGIVLEVALGALNETDLPGEWREQLEAHLGAVRDRAVREAREVLEGLEIPGLDDIEERLPADLEDARDEARRVIEGVFPRRQKD